MRVRVFDRLLGREVEPPFGRVQPGRISFVPGDRTLSVNGALVQPGDYLVSDGTWVLRDENRGTSTEGDFGRHAPADEVTAHVLLSLGRVLRNLEGAPASHWLAEMPLMGGTDMDERLRLTPLDEAVDERLPALRAVCHRPVTRLRTVEKFVPVGQVRRIVPRAIIELGARSQDWARLTPGGVRPERLLSPSRETDLDFYENRVVARLVDGLLVHVQRRLAEVGQIAALLGDVGAYADDAGGRPWQERGYLFQLIADLYEDTGRDVRARLLRDDLGRLRDALAGLRGPSVLPGVHRKADIGAALRSTNVLTNDDRYRQAAELWRVWVAGGSAAQSEGPQEWCEAFTAYTGLLLLHALRLAGLDPEGDMGTGRVVSAGDISLTWEENDVFTLSASDGPILRIVPLAHAVTASAQPGTVAQEIDAVRSAGDAKPRTLVVYPGQRTERAALPLDVRLRAFQGCEAPAPSEAGREPAMLPISPLEIDSVPRLARSLRWSVIRARVAAYPLRVACPREHTRAIVEGSDWLSADTDGLRVLRPPAPHELDGVLRRLDEIGRRRFATGPSEVRTLDLVRSDLSAAADAMSLLARCPLCHRQPADPVRSFKPRTGDRFFSRCTSCDIRWEVRRCAACSAAVPVLGSSGTPETGSSLDGDALDRSFGSQLLSGRCWVRPAAAYCPECTVCSESTSASCARCRSELRADNGSRE